MQISNSNSRTAGCDINPRHVPARTLRVFKNTEVNWLDDPTRSNHFACVSTNLMNSLVTLLDPNNAPLMCSMSSPE